MILSVVNRPPVGIFFSVLRLVISTYVLVLQSLCLKTSQELGS